MHAAEERKRPLKEPGFQCLARCSLVPAPSICCLIREFLQYQLGSKTESPSSPSLEFTRALLSTRISLASYTENGLEVVPAHTKASQLQLSP